MRRHGELLLLSTCASLIALAIWRYVIWPHL